jgi:hypothetical protein
MLLVHLSISLVNYNLAA